MYTSMEEFLVGEYGVGCLKEGESAGEDIQG